MDLFLVILVLSAGFYMAWSIGANDVANAMGTSVGSKALTLRQAVLLAGCLEFLGAYLFGSHVSQTIQSGILDIDFYTREPLHFVLGMLSALLAAGGWLQLASYRGWPVSTTHSIIGALVGFGLVSAGPEVIYWPLLLSIVASWVVSPLLGGLISYQLFSFIRRRILMQEDPIGCAKVLVPLLAFATFFVMSSLLLHHGLHHLEHLSWQKQFVASLFVASFGALIGWFWTKNLSSRPEGAAFARIPDRVFSDIEEIFAHLQIVSAAMMAFAHGANDVANAVAPISAALAGLSGEVGAVEAATPAWLLLLGGVGIVIGLATWGWRVMETVGKKITELTPSRGFAAEVGAATTVVFASGLGLPISTTHTLVGSVLGVGFARGINALNIHTLRNILLAWVVTVPVGALIASCAYYLLTFFLV